MALPRSPDRTLRRPDEHRGGDVCAGWHQLARVAAPVARPGGACRGGRRAGRRRGLAGSCGRAPSIWARWCRTSRPARPPSQSPGCPGGAWPIDDDGDAVGRAWPPQDRRAEPLIARWRQDGTAQPDPPDHRQRARRIAAAAPRSPGWPRIAPARWTGAATAFTAKDCVYFFCTGERGDRCRDRSSGVRRLAHRRLRPRACSSCSACKARAHLLPEIVDGMRHHGELTMAAAGRHRADRRHARGAGTDRHGRHGAGARPRRARSRHRGHPAGATSAHMRAGADPAAAEALAGQITDHAAPDARALACSRAPERRRPTLTG